MRLLSGEAGFVMVRRTVNVIALVVCFVAASAMSGCGQGESGPQRFDVSGTVTYDSLPVPAGSIQFMPDTSKGNSGPIGYASIVDGKFNTAEGGKGVVEEGAYLVTISGLKSAPVISDTPPNPDDPVEDNTLFPDYQVSVELTSSSSPQDFIVPVAASN